MCLSEPRVSQQNQQVLHLGLKFPLRGVDDEAAGRKLVPFPSAGLRWGIWRLTEKQHNSLVDFPRMLAASAASLCRFFLLQ